MNPSRALVTALLVAAGLATGCSDECAFTGNRPVTVTPATSCLVASIAAPYSNQSIAGCEAPTLIIHNACTEPVVVSGSVTADGTDVVIEPAGSAEILVRLDLGTVIGTGLVELVVPATIGAGAITIAFVLVKEERTVRGGGDDDDDD